MCDVSIIIVSYNTKTILADCIKSILEKTSGLDYEIIVVDNSSKDGTVDYISELFAKEKNIRLIVNKNNVGFGQANNIGVEASRGKYIFLLNSDTLLLNNAVLLFFKKAESLKEDNIFGCYLKDVTHKDSHSYGFFESKKSVNIKLFYLTVPIIFKLRRMLPLKYHFLQKEEKYVDFITGADLFMKKGVFVDVGGFDPKYFMYSEDEDFCLHAKLIGYRCRILCEPEIIHLDGGSSKKGKSKIKRKIQKESLLYYKKKWHKYGIL